MRVEGAVVRAVVRTVDPVGAGDSGGVAVREERAVRPAVGRRDGLLAKSCCSPRRSLSGGNRAAC